MKHIKRKLMLIILSIITIINLNYADEIIIKQGNTTTIKTVEDEQIFGATPTYNASNYKKDDAGTDQSLYHNINLYSLLTNNSNNLNVKMTQDDEYYKFVITSTLDGNLYGNSMNIKSIYNSSPTTCIVMLYKNNAVFNASKLINIYYSLNYTSGTSKKSVNSYFKLDNNIIYSRETSDDGYNITNTENWNNDNFYISQGIFMDYPMSKVEVNDSGITKDMVKDETL